jgi:methylglutaconyl-CoA hydratase
MGAQAARRYFLTAERFTAAEAGRLGLAHEVVATEALDAMVQGLVSALVAASPNAVAEAKRLVHDMTDQPLTAALVEDTVARIADIRASDQGREGVKSFLEKRKPSWLI